MSTIFLSHSSDDDGPASEVKAALREWNYRPIFLDFDPEDGIPAGCEWEKEIYTRLRQCRAMIVLCSDRSMSSPWCFAEITHAKALGKKIFPVMVGPCTVHSLLSLYQVIDLTGVGAARSDALSRLAAGLRHAGLDPRNSFAFDPSRSPYPGLLAFQEEDAAVFFGRERQTDRVVETLQRMAQLPGPRLLLVLGASGSGKSSLTRAGVVPRLRLQPNEILTFDPFRPLQRPIAELALSLVATFERHGVKRDVGSVRALLEKPTAEAAAALHDLADELRVAARAREARVLIVLDQAEELLGPNVGPGASALLDLLRAVLAAPSTPFLAVVTLRSDFLAEWETHPALREVSADSISVPGMSPAEFHLVITGPAIAAGIELEDGLSQALVADTESSDSLPLLAFALRELWERRSSERSMTLVEYRDTLGGLQGSVARAAEALLPVYSAGAAASSTVEIDALRRALTAMVRVNDAGQYVRKPAAWDDLPLEGRGLLERFVKARLLVSRADDDQRRVLEVAHEAMFRSWQKLVVWLEEDRDLLLWQQRLRRAREEWIRGDKDDGGLLRGPALVEAAQWLALRSDRVDKDEKELVAASVAMRDREAALRAEETARRVQQSIQVAEDGVRREMEAERRRRVRRWTIAVGSAIAVAIAVLVISQARQAAASQHAALARRLASDADRQLDESADGLRRSALFANESVAELETIEGFSALTRALMLLPRRPERAWKAHDNSVVVTMTSPDRRFLATADQNGIAVWELPNRRLVFRSQQGSGTHRMAFSRDGSWLAGPCEGGACVWQTATGNLIKLIPNREQAFAFSFGGPQSDWLAIAWYLGRTKIYQTSDWKEASELDVREQHQEVAVSSDGKLVATSAGGGQALWLVATGQPVSAIGAYVPHDAGDHDSAKAPWPPLVGYETMGVATLPLYGLRSEFWVDQPAWLMTGNSADKLSRIGLDVPGTASVSITLSPLRVRNRERLRHEILRATEDVVSASVVDDQRLAAGLSDGWVVIWPMNPGGWEITRRDEQPPVRALLFSADGRRLAAIFGNPTAGPDAPGSVHVFDVDASPTEGSLSMNDRGALETNVAGAHHGSGSSAMAWSHGGAWLAVKTPSGVDVFDSEKRARIARVPLSDRDPSPLMVFSPDDRRLLICAPAKQVTVIDTSSWHAREAVSLESPLVSLAFSPDGNLLATETRGQAGHPQEAVPTATQVWDLAADGPPHEIAWRPGIQPSPRSTAPLRRPISGGSWSRVGDLSAWSKWSVEDDTLTSADGKWQMTTSTDDRGKTPAVVHVPTHEALPLEPDLSDPNDFPKPLTMAAAFSPDGRWLAAARSESGGPLRIWPLRATDLAAETCSRVSSNLKPSEWKDYPERRFHATCPKLPLGTD